MGFLNFLTNVITFSNFPHIHPNFANKYFLFLGKMKINETFLRGED